MFLLAVGVRLALWTQPKYSSAQFEEALEGLMARHFLKGEITPFLWGQTYLGTLETYFMAFFFWLFGSSMVTLRIGPFLVSLASLAGVYFLGRELFNRKIACLALFFLAVPPFLFLHLSLMTYTGYHSSVALGALVMLLTYRMLFRRGEVARPSLHYLAIGFLCGLMFWLHPFTISFSGATLLLFLACEKNFWRGRGILLFVAGGLIGAAPLIGWNLTHRFATFASEVTGHEAHPGFNRLIHILILKVPYILGMERRGWQKIVFWILYAPFYLFLFVASARAFLNLLRRGNAKWDAASFLAFYFAMGVAAMLMFQYNNPRYLFPLYATAPLLLAYCWSAWENKSRWIAPAAMALLVGINLNNISASLRQKDTRPDPAPVIAFLESQNIRHVYGEGRLVWPMAFQSAEKITGSDMIYCAHTPYYRAGLPVNMAPHFNFGREVALAENIALIAHDNFPEWPAARIQYGLKSLGAEFKIKTIGNYTVFYDLVPPAFSFSRITGPDAFKVNSSVSADKLSLATDQNLSTYWTTGRHQKKGDLLEIDFGRPTALGKISILAGDKPLESPHSFIVQVTSDGKYWKRTLKFLVDPMRFDWVGKNPRCNTDHALHLYFSGEKVLKARIVLTEDSRLKWSVAELLVFEAGSNSPEASSGLAPEEAVSLIEKNKATAVYASDFNLLRLQKILPEKIYSPNLFERWLAPLCQSSGRVDFSRVNAFWVASGEAAQLKKDLERLRIPVERLAAKGGEEFWLGRGSALPAGPWMLWKEQRLFSYFDKNEYLQLLAVGEEEWKNGRLESAENCWREALRKYPFSATGYFLLKERLLERKDEKGLAVLEKKWKPIYEPKFPRQEKFGKLVRLVGVTLPEKKEIQPGGKVRIECEWECMKQMAGSWQIFVHFEGADGARFQADHVPPGGGEPDGRWLPGERVADIFEAEVPERLPSGNYQIWIGWFDAKKKKGRLPVFAPDGKKIGSRLKIGELVYAPRR